MPLHLQMEYETIISGCNGGNVLIEQLENNKVVRSLWLSVNQFEKIIADSKRIIDEANSDDGDV
jgi:hypothetical protein